MSTGFLMFPIGYAPTNDGAVVPGGKLTFSRTGTSTAQNTYNVSTLGGGNENSNPVVLNAEGYLDTKVYGDPTTGFKYRVTFTDANDVQIWQVDDVTMGAADAYALGGVAASSFPQVQTGSFTATITGHASNPTGTVKYTINGTNVKLYRDGTEISDTSNSTSMTLTGLPAACQPAGARQVPCILTDNSVNVSGKAVLAAGSGTITFGMGAGLSTTGFTSSGSKGIATGWEINYSL